MVWTPASKFAATGALFKSSLCYHYGGRCTLPVALKGKVKLDAPGTSNLVRWQFSYTSPQGTIHCICSSEQSNYPYLEAHHIYANNLNSNNCVIRVTWQRLIICLKKNRVIEYVEYQIYHHLLLNLFTVKS